MDTLRKKIDKVDSVFGVENVINTPVDKNYILRYYEANKIPYTLLFSDFIHLGVSYGKKFKKKDMYEPLDFVSRYLGGSSEVLELAGGRGKNTHYLAKKHPDKKFTMLDICPEQLKIAKKYERKRDNMNIKEGDFHTLPYPDDSFDTVFIVGALNYAIDKDKVVAEINRVLTSKGRFILMDGYCSKNKIANEQDRKLKRLIEVGIAVDKIQDYYEAMNIVSNNGFSLEFEKDWTREIMPCLRKLENMVRPFFDYAFLHKLMRLIMPKKVLYNSIPGYLLTESIKRGIACYNVTVWKKD